MTKKKGIPSSIGVPPPASPSTEEGAVPKHILQASREYLRADVRLISACQDEQESSAISNVDRLGLSFVSQGTQGGAATSLFLQKVYGLHKLHKQLRQAHEKQVEFKNNRRAQNAKIKEKNKVRKEQEREARRERRREREGDGYCDSSSSSSWSSDPSSVLEDPSYQTISFGDILVHMLEVCQRNNYPQIPQLSCSKPCNVEDTVFEIVPSSATGTKRALLIGCNYPGMPFELTSCHGDVHNMAQFLKNVHGFEDKNIVTLIDDGAHTDPTRKNILRAIQKFALSSKKGDSCFFLFSGHGGEVEDESGDEATGYDQALLPTDYLESGEVIDDEIFKYMLLPLPEGCTLTALVDCCHSGTIFDLPFEYNAKTLRCDYEQVTFPHMKTAMDYKKKMKAITEKLSSGKKTTTSHDTVHTTLQKTESDISDLPKPKRKLVTKLKTTVPTVIKHIPRVVSTQKKNRRMSGLLIKKHQPSTKSSSEDVGAGSVIPRMELLTVEDKAPRKKNVKTASPQKCQRPSRSLSPVREKRPGVKSPMRHLALPSSTSTKANKQRSPKPPAIHHVPAIAKQKASSTEKKQPVRSKSPPAVTQKGSSNEDAIGKKKLPQHMKSPIRHAPISPKPQTSKKVALSPKAKVRNGKSPAPTSGAKKALDPAESPNKKTIQHGKRPIMKVD